VTPRQLWTVGAAGLVAALFFFVGFIVDPTPPTAGQTAASILQHAGFSAADRAAAVSFGLSAAALLVFVTGLRAWFGAISGAPAWWRTVLLSGGIATASLLLVASTLFFTLASRPVTDPQLVTLTTDWANYAFVFAGFPVLITVGALTALMLATGGPLALLGRLGVAVTTLQLLFLATLFFTSGPLVTGGVVSIIGFGAAALFFTLTAVAVLWFARLMAAAARPA
jgi:hypothetical protein